MDLDRYVILRTEGGWVLQWNGTALSLFPDRSNAVRAAHAAARISRARGRAVDIQTRDGDAPVPNAGATALQGG
jgi:hypothetical protein